MYFDLANIWGEVMSGMGKVVIAALVCAVAAGPVSAKEKDKHKHKNKAGYSYDSSFEEERVKRNKYEKSRKLPPGLQKKVARGESLPPGWQKKLRVGDVLDPEYFKRAEEIKPDDKPGVISVRIDDIWVDLYETSREIIKIMTAPQ